MGHVMNTAALKPLFVQTLQNPREAAGQVLRAGVPTQALWIALSLVSVVSSLILAALLRAGPLPAGDLGELVAQSPAYNAPLIFAMMQWGRVVLSVFMLFWVGRMLSGQGELRDVLAVVTWLQVVSFVVVAGLSVLGLLIPILSSLGMLAFFLWWLWALACFVDMAHRFDSPLKAIGVLVVSIVGVILGLAIIMAVIGGILGGLVGAR